MRTAEYFLLTPKDLNLLWQEMAVLHWGLYQLQMTSSAGLGAGDTLGPPATYLFTSCEAGKPICVVSS